MPMHTSLRDGAEKNIEYGEIAQLARAHGSYPWCRGFKSPSRYLMKTVWRGCLFLCHRKLRPMTQKRSAGSHCGGVEECR